jgi:hypothetical protein
VSDYPEHDKLQAVQAGTQAAGEFVDWLAGEGIHLMTYREDLTDTLPVDARCESKVRSSQRTLACDPKGGEEDDSGEFWWVRHCHHWQDPEREASGDEEHGICCRCGKGRIYEIHGLKVWVGPGRNLQALLADWSGIDQRKLEAEKRAMLAALQAANAKAGG